MVEWSKAPGRSTHGADRDVRLESRPVQNPFCQAVRGSPRPILRRVELKTWQKCLHSAGSEPHFAPHLVLKLPASYTTDHGAMVVSTVPFICDPIPTVI